MTKDAKFAMYFASIVAMRLHPKNIPEATPAATEPELQYAFDIATRMMDLTEDSQWPS